MEHDPAHARSGHDDVPDPYQVDRTLLLLFPIHSQKHTRCQAIEYQLFGHHKLIFLGHKRSNIHGLL